MNSKKQSSISKVGLYALGTFGSKVLVFLLVPLYSFYLTKEQFGFFDVVLTSINVIVPFVSLQIADGVFRWLMDAGNDFDRQQKIVSNAVAYFVVSGLIVLFSSLILYLISPIDYHILITLLCVVSIGFPMMQQIARGMQKTKVFAFSGAIYTVTYLCLNIVLLVGLGLKIEALLYSTILGYLVGLIVIVSRLKLWYFFDTKYLDFAFCKDIFAYSVPLIPNTISWWLINSANKYFILFFLGVSANGIYAMANRFPIVILVVNQIFVLVWQEEIMINYKKGAMIDNLLIKRLIRIQLVLVFVLTCLSQLLVERILSEDFVESWKIMPLSYLGVAFLSFSSYYGAFYLAAKQTKQIFVSTIIASLISLGSALLLIKFLGLYGIAMSVCIGFAVLFFMRVFSSRRIVSLEFPWRTLFIYLTLVAISMIVASLGNVYTSMICLICGLLFICLENRSDLKIVVSLIKKCYEKFK